MTKCLPILALLTAFAFSAADFAHYYDKLPNEIDCHFDLHGNANDWTTKRQFVEFAIVTFAIVTVVLVPIAFLIRVVPRGLINLPNKDFWLAPEREAETRRAIASWFLWFPAGMAWFLALLFHDALTANLHQPPRLQSIWWLAAAFLAFIIALIVRMLTRFSRIPSSIPPRSPL